MTDIEQQARELPDAAIAALAKGRKIEAVKIVRREWSVGLKEAKDAVDHYQSVQDPSQRVRRSPTSGTGSGWILRFVILVAIAGTAYYLWSKT